jgi:uncharacterized protein (TIGR03545 family)
MKKFLKGFLKTVIVFLLVIVILVAALIIFRGPIADYLIETFGSRIAGAKVEVDGVYLKPLKLHITWERLQFTDRNDTWKNLFETGECDFELDFKPLLAGKVLIDKMQIEDMRFDTKRDTDGKLPASEEKQTEPSNLIQIVKANLEREKNRIPVFDPKFLKTKIDVNSLLEEFNFHTPAKADSIKDVAEDRYAYWENLIDNNDYEERIRSIEESIKEIDPDKRGNLLEIQQNLTLALDSYNSTIELYDEIRTDKTLIEEDLVRLKSLYKDVPVWIKADYDNALLLAKLPDVSVQKIAFMLFGDRVTEGIMLVLEKIEAARNLQSSQPESQENEKMPHLPAFWIKELLLSAYPDDEMLLTGKLLNISSDQSRTGQPIDLTMAGEDEKLGNLKIIGLFDHRSELKSDIINIFADEIPIRDMNLPNFDLLPKKLNKGTAKLYSNIKVSDEIIKVNVGFEAAEILFDYTSQPDMDERLIRISRSISEGIDEITFDAGVTQKSDNFTFSLSSNLDQLISTQLKKVVTGEISRAKDEIRSKVYAEMDKYRGDTESYINSKNVELQDKIDLLKVEIDKQKDKIESKKQKIEDGIEAEKQKLENAAEEKVGDELDNLLDKFKQ